MGEREEDWKEGGEKERERQLMVEFSIHSRMNDDHFAKKKKGVNAKVFHPCPNNHAFSVPMPRFMALDRYKPLLIPSIIKNLSSCPRSLKTSLNPLGH